MKELSLNVLDIVGNSTNAGATLVQIDLQENDKALTLQITDNGCGMLPEVVKGIVDPFYTTRTTRKVGMGIPLLKMAAEQTGGQLTVESRHASRYPDDHGTVVRAHFNKQHIDFTPLGDMISTIITLVQGNPHIDFVLRHDSEDVSVELDTRQMREILGDEIQLSDPEILRWIGQYLHEQYKKI